MSDGYEYKEDDPAIGIGDARLWRRLLEAIAVQWKGATVAVALSFIITGTSLSLPWLVQITMDRYILNGELGVEARLQGVTRQGMFFLGMVLLGFTATFFQVLVLERTGQRIMHALRPRLCEHLLTLDLSFFNANPVGRLVTRLTNDIQNLHEMFTSVIITLFNDGVRVLGILVLLFLMDWKLSLLLSAILPVMVVITRQFGNMSRKAFREIRTYLASINSFIQETVTGMSVVQLFLRERDMHGRFAELNDGYYRSALYQIWVFGIFVPLIEVMNSLALALIIWYGGGEVVRGRMTIGVLTAFISYMRLFFQPLRELSQKYTIVQSAMASSERIFQVLETGETLGMPAVPVIPEKIEGEIEFRDVEFAYEVGRPVFEGLSFRVRSGETLAVVGSTGSGKTTIINLLERFYDPSKGAVLLDGADIRTLDPHRLRDHIGMVMQDVLIVPGTVRENILLDRELPAPEIDRIVERAQLGAMVRDLPQGLDTLIGEGNMDLSAGQRQLLAFARVLARDPKILILDEATANVDTQTEMRVEQAIQAAMSGRTSIVIAHRLSTIRRADRILVLDHGKIVEQGTHDALMARKGVYHHLQMLQNGDREQV